VKYEAVMKVKRGLKQDKKPNAMEVEREVYHQSHTTDAAKKRNERKATAGKISQDSLLSSKKSAEKKKATKEPPAAILGGRAPPKKAIQAAIQEMESTGYNDPSGHQVMMTFVPTAVSDPPGRENNVSAFCFTVEPRKFGGVSTYREFFALLFLR
jgi:hypothetical protein